MSERWSFLSLRLINTARVSLAAVMITSISAAALARPTGLGVFSPPDATGKGSYITALGSKGTYVITGGNISGYAGTEFKVSGNGLQVLNKVLQGDTTKDKDKFEYKITLIPDDATEVHNVLIAQSTYEATGNSEIAKQTLTYEPAITTLESKAVIVTNPSVNFFYDAMGDYFMGKKLTNTSASARNAVPEPQLRVDSSAGNPLYYFNIKNIQGATETATNSNIFTLPRGALSLQQNVSGVLPPNANIDSIFKSAVSPLSYAPLSAGTVIANGSSYVSFGIENTVSDYLIKVSNAKSVTLNYQGIMNGNMGVVGGVVGETFNEWITFGVSSEPSYSFSGKVFNDNGAIDDSQADLQTTGGIYNDANYFNGVLNTNEKGITGSTIQLVSCTDKTKIYATKQADANGDFRFDIAQSLLPSANVCLTETSISPDYLIATSASTRTITLSPTTKDYPNQNFGRVIAKNAPLVLEKFQLANQCNLTALGDSSQNVYSKAPITSSNANVAPMNCIAYKLTATNRANLPVDSIVIQDTLAKKGFNGALVTSFLVDNDKRTSAPTPAVGFTDTLTNGQNGVIKTAAFSLAAKKSRSFYFNTKYGSTQSP